MGKVEQLLNSVLKELQKEKARARQLEEQVKKLQGSAMQQQQQPAQLQMPVAVAAIAELKDQLKLVQRQQLLQQQQQQQAADGALAKRITTLEGALEVSSKTSAAKLDEVRRQTAALEARVVEARSQKLGAGAPAPRHREVPPPPSVATAPAAPSSAPPTSEIARVEARVSSLEKRSAAEGACQRETAKSLAALQERLLLEADAEASRATQAATAATPSSAAVEPLHMATVEAIEARLEAMVRSRLEAHTERFDEELRRGLADATETHGRLERQLSEVAAVQQTQVEQQHLAEAQRKRVLEAQVAQEARADITKLDIT